MGKIGIKIDKIIKSLNQSNLKKYIANVGFLCAVIKFLCYLKKKCFEFDYETIIILSFKNEFEALE